ncbi:MAG: response regulator [Verrucomicrobia bacterium]|nr:response regulator [Verrucomicrobiota bacterium]
MKKEISVLLLEDDIADAELVKYALREGGLNTTLERVETRDDFLSTLKHRKPDLILSDYALPSFDGLSALAMAQEKHPDVPFIFVTGTLGEEVAIRTLKSGATDYVLKTRLSRLVPALHRALREADERAERKRAEERLRESHEQLRALSVYLQYVREEERTRIAREVHDELGQAMTSLKMDLSWLGSRLPRDLRQLQTKIKAMSTHIDATIQTIRRISTELRPGILDDFGLVAAIEWQAHEFQTRTGIECVVTATVRDGPFDQDINTAFFRIFQETLTNVMRHAKATHVQVRLSREGDALVMEVQDNGRGISEGEISNVKSIGLLGMRERAALMNGGFQIRGVPGKGTTVNVRIPLPRLVPPVKSNHEDPPGRRSRGSPPRVEADSRG